MSSLSFFFNDTATTEIYTLSLHDALPISTVFGQTEASPLITQTRPDDPAAIRATTVGQPLPQTEVKIIDPATGVDRKSTRLNSSHANISYAVFCLKKKNKTHITYTINFVK